MPYQAEQDVTVPKVIGSRPGPMGKRIAQKESINYGTGAVLFEKDIDPAVLARLEDGDDHLSTLLRYVDAAEARAILDQQVQEFASQPADESEVLHQEERLGGNPSVDPSVEVGDSPPYEPPVETDSADTENSTHVKTEDQTTGQGTSTETSEPASDDESTEGEVSAEHTHQAGSVEENSSDDAETVEEEAAGESESAGEAQSDTAEDVEASTETQEAGQDPAAEDQTDAFDAMTHAELKKAAASKKIKGRTTMSEDDLRAALRKAA